MVYHVIFDASHTPSKPIGIVYCNNIYKNFLDYYYSNCQSNKHITYLFIDQFKEEHISRTSDKLLKFLKKKGLL